MKSMHGYLFGLEVWTCARLYIPSKLCGNARDGLDTHPRGLVDPLDSGPSFHLILSSQSHATNLIRASLSKLALRVA